MKFFLFTAMFCCVFLGVHHADEHKLATHPNMIVVGTDKETVCLHPSKMRAWMFRHKPTTIHIAQISLCKINGVEVAITAPHVITGIQRPHQIPVSAFLGPWVNAPDGREIAFAKALNSKGFGFSQDAVEAAEPKKGVATIRAARFVDQDKSVVAFEISGVLERVDQPEHLAGLTKALIHLKGAPAFVDRLTRRAPKKSLLAMTMAKEYLPYVQGLSGGLVWREGKPVGVFVACLSIDGAGTLAICEPLKESAIEALPLLK